MCSCLQYFCNPGRSLSAAMGNPVYHSAMTKWSSYFWHFSCAPTQQENCKRHWQSTECPVNTWHAAPNPLAANPAAHPRVFSSKSVFQQPIYKMPKVCPEHSWKPKWMSPQTGCLVLLLMFVAALFPHLSSKLHRYHYTLQILLLPTSTISSSQKSKCRLQLGLHMVGIFYFRYTPLFMLPIHWKKICNLWLLL